MKLWIDLDNSPHVMFFAPIIRELEKAGIETVITVRAFAQTEELARQRGLRFTTIGEHRTPHSKAGRVAATLKRAYLLARYIKQHAPSVAISHGSRAMTLAAWVRGIPSLVLFDYEFISSGVFVHLSSQVMTPSLISPVALGKLNGKLVQYPGFKEEVYVYDFQPDAKVLQELGLDLSRVIVTVRPPAPWAHYHDHQAESLFRALIDRLRDEAEAQVVVLPRTAAQADELMKNYDLNRKPFHIVRQAIDGLSLMWYSDVLFSGGGTMVREAALLGVDSYSTFTGTLGAADKELVNQGKLSMIRSVSELQHLQVRKRASLTTEARPQDRRTRDFICQRILAFARGV